MMNEFMTIDEWYDINTGCAKADGEIDKDESCEGQCRAYGRWCNGEISDCRENTSVLKEN